MLSHYKDSYHSVKLSILSKEGENAWVDMKVAWEDEII